MKGSGDGEETVASECTLRMAAGTISIPEIASTSLVSSFFTSSVLGCSGSALGFGWTISRLAIRD